MKIQKLASMLASTSIAFSAFADDHGEKDYLSPFNVIGSKSDVSNLQGTGTVLNSDDLGPFFHTDITEILRQVPGVYVRPEEGYGLFPNISLRGTDPNRSSKVTIMEDGIPSSPSPFSDPSAYYSPTAGRMAGFEVLKGSSQLKYGPNTTGGVINYLSTPIPNSHLSHLRASYGENNERISHAYSGGKSDFAGGKLGYLVEVFDHRTDGWKSISSLGDTVGSNAPVAKTDISLKLSYEFGEGNYLEFKAGRTDLDADVSYIGLDATDIAANPYQRYHNTKLDNMDSDQKRYYLRYMKEIDEDTDLKMTVFHNEFNRDWYKIGKVRVNDSTNNLGTKVGGSISTYESKKYDHDGDSNTDEIANPDYSALEDWKSIGKGAFESSDHVNMLRGSGAMSVAALDGTGQVKYKHNDRNYENTGFQTSLQKQWGNHYLDLGTRFTKDHYTYKDYTEDIYNVSNLGDHRAALSFDSTSTGTKGTGADRISKVWETYLTDEINLGALKLTPGLRYTSAEYEYKNVKGTVSDTLLGVGGSYEFDSHLLFAGIHQGHALPGYSGASGMEEEKSLGFEIGSRGSLSIFNYEVAYFNTSIEDMIAIPSVGSGLGDDATNIGEASIDGVEILIATDLNRGEGVQLPLSFGATFTKAEFDTATESDGETRYDGGLPGNKIPYIPDVQFNIRGGIVSESFSTFLNYHWQDKVFVSAANTSSLDEYSTLDWSAFYTISEGVGIFAKVTNITDEEYIMSDLPDGFRSGAPRIASLGMEFEF
jgi:Fe(3+) dicitrate transport protein